MAANILVKKIDLANKIRKRTGLWLGEIEELEALIGEYDAIDAGNNLGDDFLVDITNAEYTGSVSTVKDFFDNWITQPGFKTNLYKLSDGSQR